MTVPVKRLASGEDAADGARNDNLPVPYEVGYGKPPAEHRFEKGQSGNPKGRPRKSRNKLPALNPREQPTDSLILEEAYRQVTIREGGHIIELPAIQASMRALAISAMKGSRLSQKALAEIVRDIEDRRAKQHLEILESMFDYKMKWKAEIERCEKLGIEAPQPLPHPDDVIINFRTGELRTDGPLDEREKASYDERIARREEAQTEVNCFAVRYRRAKSEERRGQWLEEWHFEQRIFDIINDGLPERYKAKLENRSFRPGASREGKTLKEFVEDRKRPKRQRKWGDYVED